MRHENVDNNNVDNAFKQNLEKDVIQCFIGGLSPYLDIRVEEKDTFKEVIDDSIDIDRRLAATSAMRKNRNTDYLKTEESTNDKNNLKNLPASRAHSHRARLASLASLSAPGARDFIVYFLTFNTEAQTNFIKLKMM